MKYFVTEYPIGEGRFGSVIEADDRAAALLLAHRRGLGERILSNGGSNAPDDVPLSVLVGAWRAESVPAADEMAAAVHAACFLGFLCLSSGVAAPREILGDEGLVHAIAHFAAGDPYQRDRQLERIQRLTAELELRAPGLPRAQRSDDHV